MSYLVFDKKFSDEVLGLIADAVEGLVVEVVGNAGNVGERFDVGVAHERGKTGEEDVTDDAHGPHVTGG